ncbi:hypothetical protein [Roseomonas sp. KE2513]|nr:hypothetical protein [Roseomonas sp. KE2513]
MRVIPAVCFFVILIVILGLIASHEIPRRRAMTDREKEEEREAQDTW